MRIVELVDSVLMYLNNNGILEYTPLSRIMSDAASYDMVDGMISEEPLEGGQPFEDGYDEE